MANVWELERHLVFKKIVTENTKSSDSYAGVGWAVRNSITSRSSKAAQSKTITISMRGNERETNLILDR